MSICGNILKITHCKNGEYIGYGKTKLKHNARIALVPLGYADGIPRQISNKAHVNINGRTCKIIGKICMDCLFIDVTNKNIHVGDSVTVFNNAEYYAKLACTSPYEILTNFSSARVKTCLFDDGY